MINSLLKIQSQAPSLSKKEKGATMVEYAIMVAMITIISLVVITGLGTETSAVFSNVSSSLKGG